MAHDVFISYSTKDKVVADGVCGILEARGIRCWIAPRDIVPGVEYGESLIDGIEQSAVVVLIFSAHANTSKHISHEIQQAFSFGKIIIPFRIEDVAPSKSLGFFIQSIHWLDALTPPLTRHIALLGDTIARNLSRTTERPRVESPRIELPAKPRPLRLYARFLLTSLVSLLAGLLVWAMVHQPAQPVPTATKHPEVERVAITPAIKSEGPAVHQKAEADKLAATSAPDHPNNTTTFDERRSVDSSESTSRTASANAPAKADRRVWPQVTISAYTQAYANGTTNTPAGTGFVDAGDRGEVLRIARDEKRCQVRLDAEAAKKVGVQEVWLSPDYLNADQKP